jgi:hypothetical protein
MRLSTKNGDTKKALEMQQSEFSTLSLPALHEFIAEVRREHEFQNSLLEFELRDAPAPHFCKWCGLNAHPPRECPHGN